MNPYRRDENKPAPNDEVAGDGDDLSIVWVWFAVGILFVLSEIGQPGPWGPWSSLGMLISSLALVALWRHYSAKRRAARKVGEA